MRVYVCVGVCVYAYVRARMCVRVRARVYVFERRVGQNEGLCDVSNSSVYPTPLQRLVCDIRSIFKQSKTCLNSEFSFWTSFLTKANEPNLPH